MDHLVGQCVLQMSLILHFIGTEQDAILGIKAACFPIRTPTTVDIMTVKIAS